MYDASMLDKTLDATKTALNAVKSTESMVEFLRLANRDLVDVALGDPEVVNMRPELLLMAWNAGFRPINMTAVREYQFALAADRVSRDIDSGIYEDEEAEQMLELLDTFINSD